ncbi:MAG: glycosyltransferase family 4 protein [Anaerolineae bacterium]|nr:glycosyltransferase family 4 protein [Anaerolineae bacterium]
MAKYTMLNLFLLDHAPFFGGAESFLLDLVSALNRDEFTPIIVTDPHSPVLNDFRASGARVLTTPLPQINRSPMFGWRLFDAGARVARLARIERADVMHSFTVRTHLIGAVASKMSGVPLLWRVCDDTMPRWAATIFGRVPRVIVAVSRYIAAYYPNVRFDGFAPDGARAPSPISRADARAQLGLRDDELVVAHVGRLVRWKGQDVFIRALARVAQKVPRVRGLIVGAAHAEDNKPGLLGGGETYARELRALADELRAPVTFTGFVREPSIVYTAADVVAHTSITPEPFGRTVIEAMMHGKPVVASNAGALPEIVPEGTGLLTPPNDANALADALTRLLINDALRAQLGTAARARAESEYSLNQMARRMEEFYRLASRHH